MAFNTTTPTVPELDLVATAKITRKTLERLAPFAHMRSVTDPSPLLTKIVAKITALIKLIDVSMLNAQMGYQLVSDAMIMSDREEDDWEADISLDRLRDLSAQGEASSQRVADGFRDIKQEVYKIAASTKDNMFLAIVPPDPTHSETLKLHLKDVGADLVANLNLLSQFSQAVNATAEWWAWINKSLAPQAEPPLPTTSSKALPSDSVVEKDDAKFAQWSKLKEGFQDYYNVANEAHVRFPDLLTESSAEWRAVASARSSSPTSSGHLKGGEPTPPTEVPTASTKGNRMQVFVRRLFSRRPRHSSQVKVAPQLSAAVERKASGDGQEVDGEAKETRTKGSPLSCCRSASLFDDGVGFLGCHGMK